MYEHQLSDRTRYDAICLQNASTMADCLGRNQGGNMLNSLHRAILMTFYGLTLNYNSLELFAVVQKKT